MRETKTTQKLASWAFIGLLGLNYFQVQNATPSNVRKAERVEARNEERATISAAVRDKVKNVLETRAVIFGGKVTAKSGITLTVNKDGKDYSVLTDANTHFRRLFWGKSTLTEISVNDIVNVHGKWTDDTKTSIQAVLVRDLSIQKRFGVFFGTVQSVTSSGFVLQTVERGTQTVTISSSTKFVNRKGEAITQRDILVGHKIRVRGLWDRANSTITQVTEVKNFSLPARLDSTSSARQVKPAITPTPTPTATP